MCEYDELLYEYYFKTLSDDLTKKVSHHLVQCEKCNQKLIEIKSLESFLGQHTRPEVPEQIIQDTNKFIEEQFRNDTPSSKILPINRNKKITNKFKLYLAAAAILIFGIFIGQNFFSNNVLEINKNNLPSDLLLLNEYASNSEILLLSFSNISPDEDSKIDINLNKSLAQNLLAKTGRISDYAHRLKDKDLILFLRRLEIILLEISNSNEQEIIEKFQELRQMIYEKQLLEKTKKLQKILDDKNKIGV